MSEKRDSFVRKPYEVAHFDEAVDIVNKQRCQICEGKMHFAPTTKVAEALDAKIKIDTEIVATCTECKATRGVWIKIVKKV